MPQVLCMSATLCVKPAPLLPTNDALQYYPTYLGLTAFKRRPPGLRCRHRHS